MVFAQALQTAVQEPWVEDKTEDNTPFYRNKETGEIVFTNPNDEVFAALFQREKEKRAEGKDEAARRGAATRGLQAHGAQPARRGRHSLELEGGDGRDESQESDMDSDEVRILGTRVILASGFHGVLDWAGRLRRVVCVAGYGLVGRLGRLHGQRRSKEHSGLNA